MEIQAGKGLESYFNDYGICLLLYLKWITNKDLLYSTGNSAHNTGNCVMWQSGWEGNFGGENGYMCTYG